MIESPSRRRLMGMDPALVVREPASDAVATTTRTKRTSLCFIADFPLVLNESPVYCWICRLGRRGLLTFTNFFGSRTGTVGRPRTRFHPCWVAIAVGNSMVQLITGRRMFQPDDGETTANLPGLQNGRRSRVQPSRGLPGRGQETGPKYAMSCLTPHRPTFPLIQSSV